MKIGIYSPYLDTAGGGEKYMLTIAEVLSELFEVDVLLDSNLEKIGVPELKEKNEKRHNLNLSKVNFIRSPFGKEHSFLSKNIFLKKYDWFFYNTDGSIFFSSAKNSIIHFQVPFDNLVANSIWGKIKLKTWKEAIFNSNFTKEYIEDRWTIRGETVYPPVDVEDFKPSQKDKKILNVGRFFSVTKVKKQHFMIDAFKKLVDTGSKNWSLHLAGGAMEGDEAYIEELKKKAIGYPIYFYPNIAFSDLAKLYSEATIYWHAMGYDETDPKKFEHFGISTVESMAAGCVPIVINKGGQKEIVSDGVDGYLWNTEAELLEKTLQVIKNPKLQKSLSKQAITRAQDFSKQKFKERILKLVNAK